MDRVKVRERFKHYRACISQLKQEIYDLNEALDSQSYCYEESLGRANKRAEACRREAEERERQCEFDRRSKEDDIRRVTSELERAREYGDSWGEDRALRKLKSIY